MHSPEVQVGWAGVRGEDQEGMEKLCAVEQTEARSGCGVEFIWDRAFEAHQNLSSPHEHASLGPSGRRSPLATSLGIGRN